MHWDLYANVCQSIGTVPLSSWASSKKKSFLLFSSYNKLALTLFKSLLFSSKFETNGLTSEAKFVDNP